MAKLKKNNEKAKKTTKPIRQKSTITKEDKKSSAAVKNITKIIPIVDVYGSAFKYHDGNFMDLLKIKCKDLTNASENEVNIDLYTFAKFFKSYTKDIKIISINFPTNTKTQQTYYQHKIAHTPHPLLKPILEEKLDELIYDEQTSTDREHFIMFWGENYDKLIQNKASIQSSLGRGLIEEISLDKKIQVLFNLANKSTSIFTDETAADYLEPNNKDELVEKFGYNPYLLNAIQPMGGVSFKNLDYTRTGEGYETCLYVYEYPKRVDRHWLSILTNNPGTITTIDITSIDTYKTKKDLKNSIAEQRSRVAQAKNTVDAMDADEKASELMKLAYEVQAYGEIIKRITTRVFISDMNYENMMKRVQVFQRDIFESNEFKAAINLSEQEYEWSSIYRSATMQSANTYSKRNGKPVTATILGGGDPFHFTYLNDKYGSHLGHTLSNGINGKVIFDLFEVTDKRKSYNAVIAGTMGSGKSTLLKKLMRDRASRGDFVRCIDVNGEFSELAYSLGGTVVSLDGSEGIINPMQINKADETDIGSFAMHLSKLSTIYAFLAPEASHTEKLIFENLVRLLYEKYGMTPEQFEQTGLKVTELPANAYPKLSDLIPLINEAYEQESNIETLNMLRNIRLVVKNLVQNYGHIFDGYTSIDNLIDTQVVVYNIKSLASLKDEIYDAQLFSVLSLCWSNAVKVGSKMKKLYENHQIDFIDVNRFMLLIDESHKSINSLKPYAVEQVLVYAREGRKYFASIILASQSIRDFVPEGTSDEAYNKIKTLFELCQYKFIMNQDSNSLEIIRNIFPDTFTETEISMIPLLERGQATLSINSFKNVTMQIEVTAHELDIFKGGV